MSTGGQPRIMRTVCMAAIGAHPAAIALYLTGSLVASGPLDRATPTTSDRRDSCGPSGHTHRWDR
jgi:hypothetical protein